MSTSRTKASAPVKKRRTRSGLKATSKAAKSPTDVAITTELAPAVAIALLEKADSGAGSPPAALDCLAAGVTSSENDDKVRVQLIFENGAVLPVEMSSAAGAALSKGLSKELAEK